jgi:hypothetical protein
MLLVNADDRFGEHLEPGLGAVDIFSGVSEALFHALDTARIIGHALALIAEGQR